MATMATMATTTKTTKTTTATTTIPTATTTSPAATTMGDIAVYRANPSCCLWPSQNTANIGSFSHSGKAHLATCASLHKLS